MDDISIIKNRLAYFSNRISYEYEKYDDNEDVDMNIDIEDDEDVDINIEDDNIKIN